MGDLVIGQRVRVLEPFGEFGEREITDVVRDKASAIVAYILGDAGAFDRMYLEPIE
jgi:hypothetical protein